ncbi:MAG: hypothetical protein SFW62_06855 [Alphaproteobacteria bacterium]|nr:hypothetical protein [Alphaproteobacteria bacterium]
MLPQWDQFVVVTTLGHCPKQAGYTPKHFFPAETCARHVYVGLQRDIAEIPQSLLGSRKGTEVHYGLNAYAWFMEFYSGLKGRHEFDLHIVRQVQTAWNLYKERYPEEKALYPYMETLFRDSALIREHLPVQYMRRPTIPNIAADIAQLAPDKTALIVGGASTITHETVTALGHRKAHNPSFLVLTHPENRELSRLEHEIRKLPPHRKIATTLSVRPFRGALQVALSEADVVFVCHPMASVSDTSSSEVDIVLCNAWKGSYKKLGNHRKIIHLKGSPQDRGVTTGPWCELEREHYGFVPLTKLQHERTHRVQSLKQMIAQTSATIRRMGETRMAGQRIRDFSYDAATMTFDFKTADGPRIRNPEAYKKAQADRARMALTL